MTRVIFRTVKHGDFKGDVMALFPDEYYNESLYGKNRVTCYEHVGQHGGADWFYVTSQTRLATADEYKDLLAELIAIGYDDLKICKRR